MLNIANKIKGIVSKVSEKMEIKKNEIKERKSHKALENGILIIDANDDYYQIPVNKVNEYDLVDIANRNKKQYVAMSISTKNTLHNEEVWQLKDEETLVDVFRTLKKLQYQ